MASPNYSEILATTLKFYADEITDNVSNQVAFYNEVNKRGKIKLIDGGETIVIPLEYAENGTYQRYSGWETLDVSPTDVISAANYDWKQVAISVSMSGLELLKNSGKERIFNLMESKVENAKHTFANNFSTDLYSAGTASGGKQIGGLQAAIPDDPTTGIYGNINRGTWSFWQSKLYDFSVEGIAAGASTIQGAMNALYLRLATDKARPSAIYADNTYFGYYEQSLQAIQRITSDSKGKSGFDSYAYKHNIPVYFDGGLGGACPSAHMYFVDHSKTYLVVHKERNMEPLGADRYAVDQDGVVKIMGWAGNLCVSNMRNQGVIIA
jgi:hypothetical protein